MVFMDCCGSYIYISKLTLEIQILRVLANKPTGYGYTQKLDQKIGKKKHFQIAMKIFLSFKDLFVPCSVTTYYMYLHNRQHNY